MAPSKLGQEREVEFLDIRHEKQEQSLLQATLVGLESTPGSEKSLPTLLLYDEQGLKLFEQITYLDEYYLTNAEIDVLQSFADNIVERIAEGTRLVEFGSGNLRKVEILLRAFEDAGKKVEYYALDLSLPELERTFSEINTNHYAHVSFHALHGTYNDGIAWLKGPQNQNKPTCVMTLGSSLGNFTREEAAAFLASIATALMPGDLLLVGLDSCQDSDKIFRAYNDSKGVTEKFYRNGLEHANNLLGSRVFDQQDWKVQGRYDKKLGRHEASYVALKDVSTGTFAFRRGEKIFLESAFKYSDETRASLWRSAGLVSQVSYGKFDYHVHLVTPSRIGFEVDPSQYAAEPLPSTKDWRQLWTAWDVVTRAMPRNLYEKPIKLRHDLIFYLGHIPAFADIHFTKATGCSPTHPAYYHSIFERGIDPDVDNPEVCHDHSEIPDTWPPLEEMLDYQARVRARVIEAITSGRASKDQKLARSLWLCFEHEAMHLETFLYMLLQSEQVSSPPGHAAPDFKSMAMEAKEKRTANKWHRVPATEVRVGLDAVENGYFGWDNEFPSRTVQVSTFEAQSRPISNGDYVDYLQDSGYEMLPVSWLVADAQPAKAHNGVLPTTTTTDTFFADKSIRTVFGLVPLEYALDWPVMASYDEIASFAAWAGGRVPTYEESKSIHQYAETRNAASLVHKNSSLISAVNGHLVNDGVEESPPYKGDGFVSARDARTTASGANGATIKSKAALEVHHDRTGPAPEDLFIDLTDANVGFANWHPTPVTGSSHLRGQGDMGGVWEWTSTPLAAHPGFEAMTDLYPGYTADFFDGKHNVILGGSWATVPRIAGRRSFVNWYQRNYLYVWAGARLVRDVGGGGG